MDVFIQFGTLLDEEDRFELKPANNFQLSSFFSAVEANGISYKFIGIHKPTLEVLFLHLTGRRLRD